MNFVDHQLYIRQVNQQLENLRHQAQLENLQLEQLQKTPKPTWRLTQLFAPKPAPQAKQLAACEQ